VSIAQKLVLMGRYRKVVASPWLDREHRVQFYPTKSVWSAALLPIQFQDCLEVLESPWILHSVFRPAHACLYFEVTNVDAPHVDVKVQRGVGHSLIKNRPPRLPRPYLSGGGAPTAPQIRFMWYHRSAKCSWGRREDKKWDECGRYLEGFSVVCVW
jgi:hypothetical protein